MAWRASAPQSTAALLLATLALLLGTLAAASCGGQGSGGSPATASGAAKVSGPISAAPNGMAPAPSSTGGPLAPAPMPIPPPAAGAGAAPTQSPSSGPSPTLPASSPPLVATEPPADMAPWTAALVREGAVAGRQGSRTPDPTGFEPIVATHPTDPDTIAVAYQRFGGTGARCGILAGLRISHDGGRTWAEAASHPWDGTTRAPSFHSAIAWGPGPTPGSARLYWIDTTVPGCDYSRHQATIAWTDDEGRSWSRLQVQTATPPWIGGFPDIAADRDPRSPLAGTVWAVYNWPGARPARGPGLRLLASSDDGRSWRSLEIPAAPTTAGHPVAWRIGYRVRPAPDGAYVSWFQSDLARWDPSDFFARGGASNVGRAAFVIVHVRLDGSTGRLSAGAPVIAATVARNGYTVGGWTSPGTWSHSYPDPAWCHGLDVDPSTGRVYLAIADYAASASPGTARGSIQVGASDDSGLTWTWTRVSSPPPVGGRAASPFRPQLAVVHGAVVVAMHWISDRPVGSRGVLVGEAWAVSFDGGASFAPPSDVPGALWSASALASALNGPGLRDRVAATADGHAVLVYGDGRLAAARGSTAGPSAVFAAILAIRAPDGTDRRR